MQSNAIFKPKIQKHMTCLDYRLGDDLVQTLLRSILSEDLIKLVGFRGPVVFLQLQLLTLQRTRPADNKRNLLDDGGDANNEERANTVK
jgi:hypothetical protein